jgi:molybdate transport system substrate-binding protein
MARLPLLALLAAAFLLASCGGDDDNGGSSKPTLTVSAASSLKEALTSCAAKDPHANVRLSFAGSDELAAQIRQGVKPDVFAAANTKLPDALFAEGRVDKPVSFATNELVVAVPADSGKVTSVDDLAAKGVTIAVGSPSVPVGSYTRDVLSRLPAAQAKGIEGNFRSNEPDVKGIVGKLTQGAVDAGFVYVTDVNATDGKLKAIKLDPSVDPNVSYGAAVVKGAKEPEAAQQYLDALRQGPCAEALRQAGFGAPPT